MAKLSKAEAKILSALLDGATLKSQRYLDGLKICQLHFLNGAVESVDKHVVESLQAQGLLYSNQKFPAATYLFTQQGRVAAALLK